MPNTTKELGLYSVKERLRGEIILLCEVLGGIGRMVDARQFEFVSNTRSRGHKLKFCIIWREFPQGI